MKKKILLLTFFIVIIFISCTDKGNRNAFKEDQKSFKASLASFEKANERGYKIQESLKSGQPFDAEQMFSEIKTGIAESEKVSDNYLDYIHPNLKSMYRNNLIGGYRLIIANRGSGDLQKAYDLDIQRGQMQIKFWEFVRSNKDEINAKINGIGNKTFSEKIKSLLSGNENKKSYWRMLFRFLISNFISVFVFSFFLGILFIPFLPLGLLREKINTSLLTVLSVPFLIIVSTGNILFWLLWSGYCVLTVLFYIDSPTVTQSWIYYLTGFLSVIIPISWLSSQEKQIESSKIETSFEKIKNINKSTFYYKLLIIISFITFCIWPNILEYKLFSLLNDFFYK